MRADSPTAGESAAELHLLIRLTDFLEFLVGFAPRGLLEVQTCGELRVKGLGLGGFRVHFPRKSAPRI